MVSVTCSVSSSVQKISQKCYPYIIMEEWFEAIVSLTNRNIYISLIFIIYKSIILSFTDWLSNLFICQWNYSSNFHYRLKCHWIKDSWFETSCCFSDLINDYHMTMHGLWKSVEINACETHSKNFYKSIKHTGVGWRACTLLRSVPRITKGI